MSVPHDYASFQPPPPPRRLPLSRGWFWLALTVSVGSLAATAVCGVLIAIWGAEDAPDLIENESIRRVIGAECDRMTKIVDGLQVAGTPRHQAAIIVQQDKAVQHMIDAVDALGHDLLKSDQPTEKWIADWVRLIALRDEFARQRALGREPEFQEPTDLDGRPILDRMAFAADNCQMPDALLDPYPVVPDAPV